MKKIMINFKLGVKFVVTLLTSREFAFIFVMLGVIAQVSHTYFLVESISSLQGWYKTFQATVMSIFISASLLYFVSIAPKQDPDGFEVDENVNRVLRAITVFTIIEVFINLFYYTKHLLLDENNKYHDDKLIDFVFGAMVSCLIPYAIKLYSSQIRAKEWINEFSDDEQPNVEITESELTKILTEKLEEYDSKMEGEYTKIEDRLNEFYDKKGTMFLAQFENKAKNLLNKEINKAQEQIKSEQPTVDTINQ